MSPWLISSSVKQGFWFFLRLPCTHPTLSYTECWGQGVRTAQCSAWNCGASLQLAEGLSSSPLPAQLGKVGWGQFPGAFLLPKEAGSPSREPIHSWPAFRGQFCFQKAGGFRSNLTALKIQPCVDGERVWTVRLAAVVNPVSLAQKASSSRKPPWLPPRRAITKERQHTPAPGREGLSLALYNA